jgi:SAM-dependent methyltransferase
MRTDQSSNPAETYEREMVPALFGPWVTPLLQAANPRPDERVLDLACGTGIVARTVARTQPTVQLAGIDLSPGMIAVARAAAQREDVSVEWHEGRLEALPFVDGRFDLALCQQGLQFVPDRPQAVAEIYRVLTDGGRVTLSLWRGLDDHPFFATLNDVVMRHIGIPALASPFSLSDGDEVRTLLIDAGFSDIVIEPRSMDALFPDPEGFIAMEVDVIAAAIPSVQHLDTDARRDLTDAISGEMAGPIRELTRDNHLVIPFHAHVVRAYRRRT